MDSNDFLGSEFLSGDFLAEQVEAQRPQLRSVAYRMLGSLGDADDAIQEAWLRLSRSDAAAIQNLGGWLTTVVGRVCLDMLRARKAHPEDSFEVLVPDPVVTADDVDDPEKQAVLADSVGLALAHVWRFLGRRSRTFGGFWAHARARLAAFGLMLAHVWRLLAHARSRLAGEGWFLGAGGGGGSWNRRCGRGTRWRWRRPCPTAPTTAGAKDWLARFQCASLCGAEADQRRAVSVRRPA